jgi:hypothetical protein
MRWTLRCLADLGRVQRGALLDVGLDEQLAAGGEQPDHLAEQHVAHDEPLGVPLLPPRIGEMHEHGAHRPGGAEPRERDLRVLGENAPAAAEPGLAEALVDQVGPLQAHLEADEAHRRVRREPLEHEAAASRADLDLDRARAGEDRRELDAVVVADGLGEPRGVRVRVMGPRAHRGGRAVYTAAPLL